MTSFYLIVAANLSSHAKSILSACLHRDWSVIRWLRFSSWFVTRSTAVRPCIRF